MMLCREEEQKKKTIENDRIRWIDFAKGIAIILVILGHTTRNREILFFIYSVHVPVFFTVSMVTSRISSNWRDIVLNTKRSFGRLIKPVIILWLTHDLLYLFAYHSSIKSVPEFIGLRILSVLFSSALPFHTKWFVIPAIGNLWFLVALFVGKTIFNVIIWVFHSKKTIGIVSGFFSVIGVILSETISPSLPFSIGCAMVVQPFFFLGYMMKRWKEDRPCSQRFFTCLLFYFIACMCILRFLPDQMLNVAFNMYPMFPVCIIMAGSGVIVVCEICKWLVEIENAGWKKVTNYCVSLGENSIWLFGVHHMDGMWKSVYFLFDNTFLQCVLRVAIDLAIMSLCLRIWQAIKKEILENS